MENLKKFGTLCGAWFIGLVKMLPDWEFHVFELSYVHIHEVSAIYVIAQFPMCKNNCYHLYCFALQLNPGDLPAVASL